jgi:hypothetical protein
MDRPITNAPATPTTNPGTIFAQEVAWAFTTNRAKMRSTTDTLTGTRFRWNNVAFFKGLNVPEQCLKRSTMELHPARTPRALLVKLNGEDAVAAWEASQNDRSEASQGC